MGHEDITSEEITKCAETKKNLGCSKFQLTNCDITIYVYSLNLKRLQTNALIVFTNRKLEIVDYLSTLLEMSGFNMREYNRILTKGNIKPVHTYGDAVPMELAELKFNHMNYLVRTVAWNANCDDKRKRRADIKESLLKAFTTCDSTKLESTAVPILNIHGECEGLIFKHIQFF